ncbi:ribulokinase [Alicyclobacillus curvatus]|nr:ribulokinase [Alicyclobacillus curvatus]
MYSIGVDYGTESGRVVLLDIDNNKEIASFMVPYRHGVIEDVLPGTSEVLGPDWALQHPEDYVEVLEKGIPEVLRVAEVSSQDVIGIGVDFTSCTVLPVTKDGEPLCLLPEWKARAHAWPKLWKHHAAQGIANRINETAEARRESFISRYGGKVSSEWYFPKLLEIFENDRDVYHAAYAFMEATDWIVWYLTGRQCRNSCTAGYKAMWSEEDGIPNVEFFTALNPEFVNPVEKLGDKFYPLGTKAGTLRPEVAQRLGLSPATAIAVGNVDAMVSAPAVGVESPGTLVMVMGTSICHLALSREEIRLPGITGVVKDGIIPGLYGYEAGQAAVGDMFAWFIKHCVPESYAREAARQSLSIYEHLERLATELTPGESGLLALDWWNGNRSILADADLTGVIVGLTLATRPEEIYRALLEATAFGTKRIVDNFVEHGVPIHDLVACGGLSFKSPLLMQLYSDITGLPVTVYESEQIPARGAAIFGAVAAGSTGGGFDSIEAASDHLHPPVWKVYEPNGALRSTYDEIYQSYREIHDFFGRDSAMTLHRLKSVRVRGIQAKNS